MHAIGVIQSVMRRAFRKKKKARLFRDNQIQVKMHV